MIAADASLNSISAYHDDQSFYAWQKQTFKSRIIVVAVDWMSSYVADFIRIPFVYIGKEGREIMMLTNLSVINDGQYFIVQ